MLNKPDAIFGRVKAVLCQPQFLCIEENITSNASLRDDLNLDSLDHAELALAIEDALGIEAITYEEIDRVFTVQDLVELVKKKVPARQSA